MNKIKDKTKLKPRVSKTKFDITDFELFGDLVLVRAIRPEASNGLVNPEQYEDKPEFGEIIKVGDGIDHPKATIGRIVRFGKYSTEVIRSNGQDYFMVHFEDMSGYRL